MQIGIFACIKLFTTKEKYLSIKYRKLFVVFMWIYSWYFSWPFAHKSFLLTLMNCFLWFCVIQTQSVFNFYLKLKDGEINDKIKRPFELFILKDCCKKHTNQHLDRIYECQWIGFAEMRALNEITNSQPTILSYSQNLNLSMCDVPRAELANSNSYMVVAHQYIHRERENWHATETIKNGCGAM